MTEIDKAPPPPPTPVEYGPIKDAEETPRKSGFGRFPDEDSEETVVPEEEPTPPPEPPAEQVTPEPPKSTEQDLAEQRIKDAQARMHEATQEKSAWQKLAQELIESRTPTPSVQTPEPEPEIALPDPQEDPRGFANAIERRAEARLRKEQEAERIQRMYDDFTEKHPDWQQKIPELRTAERLIQKNPLEAAYRLVNLVERQTGEEIADKDFEETKKDFRTAIAQQEAEKSKQTIPVSPASPTKSPIPDFSKMTAEEGWEWIKNHPEKSGMPTHRWGQVS